MVAQTTDMGPFRITRLAYEGNDISDTWRVIGIGHSMIDMERVNVRKLSSLSE